jgi:hypothetical protein
MEKEPKMTETPAHGEPGHVCRTMAIDATESLAGIIIGQHPDREDCLVAESWSNGMTKRDAAHVIRQIADQWDQDADLEESQAIARERN